MNYAKDTNPHPLYIGSSASVDVLGEGETTASVFVMLSSKLWQAKVDAARSNPCLCVACGLRSNC